MNINLRSVIAVVAFAVAMAALESAVVVYLRELYYPGQFTVALKIASQHILYVELVRELATIVMIGCVGYLTGRSNKERIAYSLICFAIWDIFYYIWLKVFIGWPLSLFDWDILFLIPVTWLGPVLAPLICSVTMIGLAGVLLRSEQQTTTRPFYLMMLGSALILFAFMKDYGGMLFSTGLWRDYANLMNNPVFLEIAAGYQPKGFSWSLFLTGESMIVVSIIALYRLDVRRKLMRLVR